LVVGSPNENGQSTGNIAVGAVYVFQRNNGGSNNWGQVSRQNPPATPGELGSLRFGTNVATSGNTVAAGVGTFPNATGNTVAVVIYERATATAVFAFSHSVSRAQVGATTSNHAIDLPQGLVIDGDTLLVAISDRNANSLVSFVERNNGGTNAWGTVQQVSLSGAVSSGVSVSGSRAAIGVPLATSGDESRVHLYERGATNWTEVKTITGSSLGLTGGNNAQYYFGLQLQLSGDTLAVGNSLMSTPSGPQIGGALLFQRNSGGSANWGFAREFVAGDARFEGSSFGNPFGTPLYLSGDTVAFIGNSAPETRVIELFSISAAPPKVLDWSDAPAPYPIATHVWGSGLRLGYTVDVDNGNPASDGSCQDQAFDDYRGLFFDDDALLSQSCGTQPIMTLTIGESTGFDVRTNGGSGKLDVWLDKNRDQNWSGASEKIVNGVAVPANSNADATSYTHVEQPLTLAEAVPGITWMRLRFSSTGSPQPSGEAADGEVEDYPVQLALPQFYATCFTASEGNSGNSNLPCNIGISTINGVNRPITHTVKVDYTTSACPQNIANPATSGTDYVPTSGTLTFAPGSGRQTINIPIKGDLVEEAREAVCLTLKNPVNATVSDSQPAAIGYIDNDDQVSISLYGGNDFSEAGGSTTVCATLSNLADHDVIATIAFSGTATKGSDYNIYGNTIAIGYGSKQVCGLTISAINDTLFEGDETVIATIKSVQGAVIGTPASRTYTIKDDDLPSVAFTAPTQTVSENVGNIAVKMQLSAPSAQAITVPLSFSGSATKSADDNASAASISIPAGSTSGSVTLSVIDDTAVEANATVVVTAGTPTNATLGATKSFTLTITDDDALASIALSPTSASIDLREPQCLTASARSQSGKAYVGAALKFTRSGANPGTSTINSGSDGSAQHCWTGTVAGTDAVKATSAAISSNAASIVWNKRATTMTAAGYIATNKGAIPALLKGSATLTDSKTGAGIAGETVHFTAGKNTVCVATTDPNGKASCAGNIRGTVGAILGRGYDAGFDGDATYKPATDRGQLACIGELCL
jgi:hypothetical protein